MQGHHSFLLLLLLLSNNIKALCAIHIDTHQQSQDLVWDLGPIKTSGCGWSGVKKGLNSWAFTSRVCSVTAVKLQQTRTDAALMLADERLLLGCYNGRKNVVAFLY